MQLTTQMQGKEWRAGSRFEIEMTDCSENDDWRERETGQE